MTEPEEVIYESAETIDAAYDAAEARAVERWGRGNFEVTANPSPSKNLTTGETLLYLATPPNAPLTNDGRRRINRCC